MRFLWKLVWIFELVLAPSTLAFAAPDQEQNSVIQASGPWHLDYTLQECHLRRDFGAGNNAVTLDISKAAGPEKWDITLVGVGVPKLPQRLNLGIRLEPQGQSQSFQAVSMSVPKQSARFVRGYDAYSSIFTDFTANQQLTLSHGNDLALTLGFGGARAAFAALQTCYESLLRSWNVDPSQVLQKPETAAGNPGIVVAQLADAAQQPTARDSWVSWKDYPSAALRAEISGTVVMALSVNAAGRVEGCRVVVSSKFELLDQKSCEVMAMRAHYQPPISLSSDALLSTAIERIRWVIP